MHTQPPSLREATDFSSVRYFLRVWGSVCGWACSDFFKIGLIPTQPDLREAGIGSGYRYGRVAGKTADAYVSIVPGGTCM